MARHLFERCLCQYGYVQDIPRLVPSTPSKGIDSWFRSNIMSLARTIGDREVEVQFPKECVDGYLEWYLTVSDHRIIPPRHHGDNVVPYHVGSSQVRSSHEDDGVPLMMCCRLYMV